MLCPWGPSSKAYRCSDISEEGALGDMLGRGALGELREQDFLSKRGAPNHLHAVGFTATSFSRETGHLIFR